MATCNDSDKRERNIKTRRLPNRIHTRLSRFKTQHNYETLWNAMVECTDQFLSIVDAGGYVAIQVAHDCTPQKRN